MRNDVAFRLLAALVALGAAAAVGVAGGAVGVGIGISISICIRSSVATGSFCRMAGSIVRTL
jgi:hypothetical protein